MMVIVLIQSIVTYGIKTKVYIDITLNHVMSGCGWATVGHDSVTLALSDTSILVPLSGSSIIGGTVGKTVKLMN